MMFSLQIKFNRAITITFATMQYFFKLTTIATFLNGTNPHTLGGMGFCKNGMMSQYLQEFSALKSVIRI